MLVKRILFSILILVTVSNAQTIPNLPTPRCSGVAEVVNDTLYFFGGANRHYLGSIRYSTIYKFDGNEWIVYDTIPDNNTLGMGSVVVGTDVYLFGGYRFGNRVVRKYDLSDKSWTYLDPGPFFSTFGSAFEYANNHVYAFLAAGTVYEYDLINDTWLEKSANSIPGYTLTSEVYDDEIYIVGYYDSTFSHPFYKYNPVTDSWTELANLPYQVVKCAMEVIGNKIYCAGGSSQGSPSDQFDSLLVYDISSDSWSIDQFELSSKRVWMADVTFNNKFLVLGGIDTTNNAVDIVEEIIPLGPAPVNVEENQIPVEFSLYQNYPNPFNPSTKIKWQSPVAGHQSLKVYDVLGNEVAALVDEYKSAGSYEVEFDAASLSSGVYFYQLKAGDPSTGSGQVYVQTRKMILLK